MTVIEIINVIYQSMFIFIFGTAIIASAIYAALSLSKEAKQAKEEEEKAQKEADDYFERMEAKLDIILKLHGCELTDDAIIRPNGVTNEKPLSEE